MLKKWKCQKRPKSTPHLFFVYQQKCLLAYKLCKICNGKYSISVTDLSSFFSIFQTSVSVCAWRRTGWALILRQKVPIHWLCHLCVVIQYPVLGRTSAVAPLYYLFLTPPPNLFPSQPIVDLSPIRRSASSLTQQYRQELGLNEYDLERPSLAQSSTGHGQVQGQDRAHHHHHHHRCHRRRDKDKDKKQKSLDRAASVQPSSTVGEYISILR